MKQIQMIKIQKMAPKAQRRQEENIYVDGCQFGFEGCRQDGGGTVKE